MKIIEACTGVGLPEPEYEINNHLFSITFYRRNENVTENGRNQILLMIQKKEQITTTELAKFLGVSRRTIARDIENLKKTGKIDREGSDKGGKWKIME